jgi:hypothetical protein
MSPTLVFGVISRIFHSIAGHKPFYFHVKPIIILFLLPTGNLPGSSLLLEWWVQLFPA